MVCDSRFFSRVTLSQDRLQQTSVAISRLEYLLHPMLCRLLGGNVAAILPQRVILFETRSRNVSGGARKPRELRTVRDCTESSVSQKRSFLTIYFRAAPDQKRFGSVTISLSTETGEKRKFATCLSKSKSEILT